MSLIVDQDATGVSALVQEELLRIDILRLENSIAYLERSNSELAIELERLGVTSIGTNETGEAAEPDVVTYASALQENVSVIQRKHKSLREMKAKYLSLKHAPDARNAR